jgi:hypothetical protein
MGTCSVRCIWTRVNVALELIQIISLQITELIVAAIHDRLVRIIQVVLITIITVQ